MFTFRNLLVAGLALAPLTLLPAQETGQRKKRADREQPGRTEVRVSGQEGRASGQLDKYFVTCLKEDNKGEVTIATIAAQRATNPDVKAFAQELVKDHTDFLAKLDRFEQSAGASRSSGTTIRTETRQSETTKRQVSAQSDGTNRDKPKDEATKRDDTKPRTADRTDKATNRPDARADVRVDVNRSDATASTTAHGGSDIANQLMQIKKEIAERCVASAQRELSAKEGREFDKCFIGMQIGGHIHMVDTLSVLNSHASADLQQIIDEGLQTSQQHLEHAKKLAQKLEESTSTAGERAATSPGKSDRTNTEKAK